MYSEIMKECVRESIKIRQTSILNSHLPLHWRYPRSECLWQQKLCKKPHWIYLLPW